MNGLEKTKKFEFNNKEDKTEVMAMKFNKQTEVEEAMIEVRKGKVKNTDLHKYVVRRPLRQKWNKRDQDSQEDAEIQVHGTQCKKNGKLYQCRGCRHENSPDAAGVSCQTDITVKCGNLVHDINKRRKQHNNQAS